MTKTTSRQYTLQDFNDIISAGFSYDFKDSNVIELISSLANKVGAPTYIKTPVFPKREKPIIAGSGTGTGAGTVAVVAPNLSNSSQDFSTANRRPRNNNKPSQITDDDWNMIRTFQKTEMKKTEGIEKRIDTIRSLLNKLTDSTYNAVEAEILTEVKDIIHSDDGGIDEENITNITNITNPTNPV